MFMKILPGRSTVGFRDPTASSEGILALGY